MKKIASFLITLLGILNFSSCAETVEYELLHNVSKIVSIQVVEVQEIKANHTIEARVLNEISEQEAFLNDFFNLRCMKSFPPPSHVDEGSNGVKITYEDGDYEFISCRTRAIYQKSDVSNKREASIESYLSFDEEAFQELMLNYSQATSYPLMRDGLMVAGIDIVEVGEWDNQTEQPNTTTLASIQNPQLFLSGFADLACYPMGTIKSLEDDVTAIKILYNTGEYEMISSSSQEKYRYHEKIGYYYGTIIDGGYLFDQATFNAFLQQYLNG